MKIRIANAIEGQAQYTSERSARGMIASGVATLAGPGVIRMVEIRRLNIDAPNRPDTGMATIEQMVGLPLSGGARGAVRLLSIVRTPRGEPMTKIHARVRTEQAPRRAAELAHADAARFSLRSGAITPKP